MYILKSVLVFCLLVQSGYSALAAEWNLTGTWESKYQFGTLEEVMIANIQQVGENILGSFLAKPSTGDDYSGIIFGNAMGDRIKANYLTVKASGEKNPQTAITFTDARIVDENTIKGTFYYQDSDMNAISSPYEATRM